MNNPGVATGYAMLSAVPAVSPAAGIARAAAIIANPEACYLPLSRGVLSQGKVPCCVSCALGSAMEILHPDWPPLATLFHYYITRFESAGADAGGLLYLFNALTTLSRAGICRFADHPYEINPTKMTNVPNPIARADGMLRRLGGGLGILAKYQAISFISRAKGIREQLRKGWPVVLGIRLPSLYPDMLAGTNQWTDEKASPSQRGHCVLAVGFDDALQSIKIQDCLGKDKFDLGYWRMGYRVADSAFVQEAYYLTR